MRTNLHCASPFEHRNVVPSRDRITARLSNYVLLQCGQRRLPNPARRLPAALLTSARSRACEGIAGDSSRPARRERRKMKPTSKTFTASFASLFTSAFFMMTAPAVHAADYCITNGAQAAHGCGYPSMEMCRAASSGIGGICEEHSPAPSNALASQPKQPHGRSERRLRREPIRH